MWAEKFLIAGYVFLFFIRRLKEHRRREREFEREKDAHQRELNKSNKVIYKSI